MVNLMLDLISKTQKSFVHENAVYPLARLSSAQLQAIDDILSETLDKKTVLAQIKDLLSIKLVMAN